MVAENPRVPLGDFAIAVDAVGWVEEGAGVGVEIEGIGSCLVPLRQTVRCLSIQNYPRFCFLNSKWFTNIRKRKFCIEKFIPLRICDVLEQFG